MNRTRKGTFREYQKRQRRNALKKLTKDTYSQIASLFNFALGF